MAEELTRVPLVVCTECGAVSADTKAFSNDTSWSKDCDLEDGRHSSLTQLISFVPAQALDEAERERIDGEAKKVLAERGILPPEDDTGWAYSVDVGEGMYEAEGASLAKCLEIAFARERQAGRHESLDEKNQRIIDLSACVQELEATLERIREAAERDPEWSAHIIRILDESDDG